VVPGILQKGIDRRPWWDLLSQTAHLSVVLEIINSIIDLRSPTELSRAVGRVCLVPAKGEGG